METQDDYHNISGSEQVVMIHSKTGHNRLSSHMNIKFKIGNSTACTCKQAPQTAEHIFQNCYEYDTLRQTRWSRG
jgi:hypothetical protein